MSRRCLICGKLNPCAVHSQEVQNAELARNDREIAEIRARAGESNDGSRILTQRLIALLSDYEHSHPRLSMLLNDFNACERIIKQLCPPSTPSKQCQAEVTRDHPLAHLDRHGMDQRLCGCRTTHSSGFCKKHRQQRGIT